MHSNYKQWISYCIVMLSIGLGGFGSINAQSLTWLGISGDYQCGASSVSDNGVVVGTARNSQYDYNERAYRWTADSGRQYLGTLGGWGSYAMDVSADGSVVVGMSYGTPNERAFRWTVSSGMYDLGTLGGCCSSAEGVSADGGVVVGEAYNTSSNTHAFRWTAAEGMEDLGTLGGYKSGAYSVSADGSVVVGYSYNASYRTRAVRWTATGGMQDLGTLGGEYSSAYDVSADGSVVVGEAYNDSLQMHAFRWTTMNGMEDLGTLSGGNWSKAVSVSDDGLIVVGFSNVVSGYNHAFRWTAVGGMEDLNEIYVHLLTDGSRLYSASAISPNGRYIVGVGYNATTGREEAYILDTQGTSSVAEQVVTNYQLYQNYPNPFNPSTTIRFSIPETEFVTLKVFDILGCEITTLVNGEMQAGEHTVIFNAKDLPGGVYFYQLKTGGLIQTKKATLIK